MLWGESLKSSPVDSHLLRVEIRHQSISKIWVQSLQQALPTLDGARVKGLLLDSCSAHSGLSLKPSISAFGQRPIASRYPKAVSAGPFE